jgi:FkbM family methyltransferase
MGLFSLASIHFWRHGIPFDYLDVGANVGMTTFAQSIFYKRCGKPNRVHAFEPGNIYPLLRRSAVTNNLNDVLCVNMAASDGKGEVTFYLTPKQSPAGSLIKAAVSRREVQQTRAIKVQTITLDEYIETEIGQGTAIRARRQLSGIS